MGSIADHMNNSSRTESTTTTAASTSSAGTVLSEADRRKRQQQDMYSARRIFIAGPAAAANSTTDTALSDLANHTHHLNLAHDPEALQVLSEETREKIRKMQRKQMWMERPASTIAATTTSLREQLQVGHVFEELKMFGACLSVQGCLVASRGFVQV